MLIGCLIALMVLCLRPEECRECGSITSRALSNRVVSALRNRLERVLLGMSADGDARAHGNGAHGEEGGEHRGRSRSRGRAATETHGRPGLEEDVPPGAEIPALEALPEEAEKSALGGKYCSGKEHQ